MPTEQESPREKIDHWLEIASIKTARDCPFCAPIPGIVRAALAALDEDHSRVTKLLSGRNEIDIEMCRCGSFGAQCPYKARHEKALARAIGVIE